MEIRVAQSDDIAEVARVLSYLRMRTIAPDDIEDIYAQILDSHYSDILIVKEGATLIAIAVLNLVLKIDRIECRLDELIVDPQSRGKGIGTQLMNACEEWAWKRNCYKIEFTSRTERASSIELYEKLGYEKRDSNIFTKYPSGTSYVKTKVI